MLMFLYSHIKQKLWPDFILGFILCVMLSGSFFLKTSQHRLFLYASFPIGLYFLFKNNTWKIESLLKDKLALTALLFLIYNMLSITWSYNTDLEAIWTKFKIAPFLLISIFIYINYINIYKKSWIIFIEIFTISAVLNGIILLTINFPDIWDRYHIKYTEDFSVWRLEGMGRGRNSNLAGLLFSVSLITLFYSPKILFPIMNTKTFKICSSIILGMVLFLTLSRAAILAAIGSFLILLIVNSFLSNDKQKRFFILITLGISTIPPIILSLFFHNTLSYMIERGSTGRFAIWKIAIDHYKESPIFGHGIATRFKYDVFDKFSISVNHEHNIYISTLLHLGIVGFILFLTLIITAWIYALQYAKYSKDYTILGILTYGYIFGLFEFGGYYTSLGNEWIVFWIPISFLIYNL